MITHHLTEPTYQLITVKELGERYNTQSALTIRSAFFRLGIEPIAHISLFGYDLYIKKSYIPLLDRYFNYRG